MGLTIEAIYDGAVFRPIAPVRLKPNTRVRVIDIEEDQDTQEQLRRLLLAAPTLSENDLQGYTQVREWMNQWTVNAF